MSNVMSMKNLKNKPSRNGFDLSENRKFTAKVGELLPVFCKTIMPGDHVELYPQHFTRIVPLNTAAYVRIKEEVNFFKVPFHLLWNRFDTFVTEMKNNPQHAADFKSGVAIPDLVPTFSRSEFANFVNRTYVAQNRDELKYSLADQFIKLAQYLGYGDYTQFKKQAFSNNDRNRSYSPFPLLAYQKVYQDYYRNQQWERASPQSFNIDYATGEMTIPTDLYQSNIDSSMLTMRYANFKKDYFFGLLPQPQYGDSSVVPVRHSVVKVSKETSYSPSADWSTIPNGGFIGEVASGLFNPSVISIRKAEAIQKLREIQQSGKQDYKEQIEKIFGVSMSDDKSDLCTWLGGYDADININEVVNNNLTGDNYADIQGKATSNGSGKIVFDSDDWCILIGIYSAIPILDFKIDAPEVDTMLVHRDHFPNPVLDRIGMEEVMLADLIGDKIGEYTVPHYQVLGYGPRYWKFKTNYDKVLGGFRNTTAYGNWVAPLSLEYILSKIKFNDTTYTPNYRLFKVDPIIMNPVLSLVIPDNKKFEMSSFDYDQLLTNMSIGCAMVRNLDYDGLPY